MKTYKRNPMRLLFRIPVVLALSAGAWFLINHFVGSQLLAIAGAAVVCIATAMIAILGGDIRFELEDQTLRYYLRGALKNTFHLPECQVNSRITRRGVLDVPDIYLSVTTADGKHAYLDCSALGPKVYGEMWEEIKSRSGDKPELLSATAQP